MTNKKLKVRRRTLQRKSNKKPLSKLPKRLKVKVKNNYQRNNRKSKIEVLYLSFKTVVTFSVEIQSKFYITVIYTLF